MIRLFVFIAISCFLAKDLASLSWEIWYQVNKQQIIAEKCENKDKPMMHCNGQCYLSKQLKKLEQREKEHSSKQNPFQHLIKTCFIASLNPIRIQVSNQAPEKTTTEFSYLEFCPSSPLFPIFHPPCIS